MHYNGLSERWYVYAVSVSDLHVKIYAVSRGVEAWRRIHRKSKEGR
jgi:hypothetical protein